MQEIAHKLLELVLGAVPTFLILLGLYAFLRVVFFGPLEEVLEKRHAATEGAREAAGRSMTAAEAKAAEYAAALDQARAEIYRAREAERQKTLEVRAALVEKTRGQAAEKIRGAREGIDADVAAARTKLREDSRSLAESIARRILR